MKHRRLFVLLLATIAGACAVGAIASGCGGATDSPDAGGPPAADASMGPREAGPEAQADARVEAQAEAGIAPDADASVVGDADAGDADAEDDEADDGAFAPNPDGCPSYFYPPPIGSACDAGGLACSYGGWGAGSCASETCTCAAGAWGCVAVGCTGKPADGCGATPPQDGTECTRDLEMCFYAAGDSGCGPIAAVCACDDDTGQWACFDDCSAADAGAE